MPGIRIPLLRLLREALRLRAKPLHLSPGLLLIVAPHPDDETLGCGGLLSRELLTGRTARILFLTDGSASHPAHPNLTPAALAGVRRAEATEACARLGLAENDLLFLDLPDGKLAHLGDDARELAVRKIIAHLETTRPTTVLLPHRHDGSTEHEAAFAICHAALRRLSRRPRTLEYLVWAAYSPRLLTRLLARPGHVRRVAFPGMSRTKKHALAAHASQFAPCPPWPRAVQAPDFANSLSQEDEFYIELD